ncbi:hypothetical protein PG993_014129 [Apiospora rasikravindrae]|uniref:Uncharacterized protein n=1 Tax=Apiospora rasikravindrae TaxID=990691 RepID=A0ABR1RS71_9PEZI
MFIPTRAGLAILWEAMTIAQQCFYRAALDEWPTWTHDLFPQGAHEVSFGAPDLLSYFHSYSVGEGDFELRGSSSHDVFQAIMGMTDLRNRTCHFPPRSDANYMRMRQGRRRRATAADELRYGIEAQQGAWTGSINWPFEPDCAGWYYETMTAARNLASVLDDEDAVWALDKLSDRVEDQAWAMLRALEEIAAFWECRDRGHGVRGPNKKEQKEQADRREVGRAMMRGLPEELRVPVDMFLRTVEVSDHGSWPEIIRHAAMVWKRDDWLIGSS